MIRALAMVIGLLVFSAVQTAHATAFCGSEPSLQPDKEMKSFMKVVQSKAHVLSQYLPHAEINKNVALWRLEQRQQFNNTDQYELDRYFRWKSCQIIVASQMMSSNQKLAQWAAVRNAFRKPVLQKPCSKRQFGQTGWQRSAVLTESSGWVSGGSDPPYWCHVLIARIVHDRNLGPQYKATIIKMWEEQRYEVPQLNIGSEYNYKCIVKLQWLPIYNTKTDKACRVEGRSP